MSADLERKMFCWPLEWINAAVKSGLADRREHGCVMRRIEGDAMRDALTEFTLLVVGHAVAEEEREAADALAAQRERIRVLEAALAAVCADGVALAKRAPGVTPIVRQTFLHSVNRASELLK